MCEDGGGCAEGPRDCRSRVCDARTGTCVSCEMLAQLTPTETCVQDLEAASNVKCGRGTRFDAAENACVATYEGLIDACKEKRGAFGYTCVRHGSAANQACDGGAE